VTDWHCSHRDCWNGQLRSSGDQLRALAEEWDGTIHRPSGSIAKSTSVPNRASQDDPRRFSRHEAIGCAGSGAAVVGARVALKAWPIRRQKGRALFRAEARTCLKGQGAALLSVFTNSTLQAVSPVAPPVGHRRLPCSNGPGRWRDIASAWAWACPAAPRFLAMGGCSLRAGLRY